jgi:hypothetical protein
MKNITYTLIVSAALAVFAIGCGDSEQKQTVAPATPKTPAAPKAPPVELPETLLAKEALPDAMGVVAARKEVEPGKEIVLTGFIGARREPFVDGRAIFTLADSKALTQCDAIPGDGCKTPWDACCDAPEKVKASIASIQVVDGDGMVLKRKLEGFGGIASGSTVSVKGKIAPGSNADVLIVNAEQIHVTPKQ